MMFTLGQLLFILSLGWCGWLWLEAKVLRPTKAATAQARTKVAKAKAKAKVAHPRSRKRTTPARRRARA